MPSTRAVLIRQSIGPVYSSPRGLPCASQRRPRSLMITSAPMAFADCEYMRVNVVSVGCMATSTQAPLNELARM